MDENLASLIQQNSEPTDPKKECMFYLNTDETIVLKNLTEFLKDNLEPDCTLSFSPDEGIQLVGKDTDKQVFIMIRLEASKFIRFMCPQKFSIGDKVSLYIKNDDLNVIKCRIYNMDKQRDNYSTTPVLSNFQDNKVDCPKYHNDFVRIPSTELQRMCRDIQSCKTVKAIKYPDGIMYHCEGDGFVDKRFTFGETYDKSNSDKSAIHSTHYDCKLFCKLNKICGFCKIVSVTTQKSTNNTQFPMYIRVPITNLGRMRIYLMQIPGED